MKKLMILLMILGISSCASLKEVAVESYEKIVYRDSTIFIVDTIEVPVPVEKIVEIVPQDTTSILSTSLAISEAKIQKGMLHHSLEQKGTIPVRIDTIVTVQYVDRIVEKEIPIITEVEKPYIPTFFWVITIYAAIISLLMAFRAYLKLKGV